MIILYILGVPFQSEKIVDCETINSSWKIIMKRASIRFFCCLPRLLLRPVIRVMNKGAIKQTPFKKTSPRFSAAVIRFICCIWRVTVRPQHSVYIKITRILDILPKIATIQLRLILFINIFFFELLPLLYIYYHTILLVNQHSQRTLTGWVTDFFHRILTNPITRLQFYQNRFFFKNIFCAISKNKQHSARILLGWVTGNFFLEL